MANEENLIPFEERTESEQREIRSKGGIASGKSRRHKRDLQKTAAWLLFLPLHDGDTAVAKLIFPICADDKSRYAQNNILQALFENSAEDTDI